jgi:hypothetical protein
VFILGNAAEPSGNGFQKSWVNNVSEAWLMSTEKLHPIFCGLRHRRAEWKRDLCISDTTGTKLWKHHSSAAQCHCFIERKREWVRSSPEWNTISQLQGILKQEHCTQSVSYDKKCLLIRDSEIHVTSPWSTPMWPECTRNGFKYIRKELFSF